MVFEDLTLRGYCTESPISGLNFDQCRIALEKLAFFHAATAVLLEKNAETFDAYSKGTFNASHGDNLKYFTDVFQEFAAEAENLGLDTKIADKFKALAPKVIAKATQCYEKSPKEFNVLNHGDFWTNNILFKYENGQLVDALFVRNFASLLDQFYQVHYFPISDRLPKLCRWIPNYRLVLLFDNIRGYWNILQSPQPVDLHLPRDPEVDSRETKLQGKGANPKRIASGAATEGSLGWVVCFLR